MLQIEVDSEEESYFHLTRAERLFWLEEYLSHPFEDESRRSNITYDNCLIYYPSIDVRMTNWTVRRHLIHLEVHLRIASDDYLFCTYECMYNYFPDYSGDISIISRIVYEIFVFNNTTNLSNFFHEKRCKMCLRYCSKVFEQAKNYPELYNITGIFSVPNDKDFYQKSYLSDISHY